MISFSFMNHSYLQKQSWISKSVRERNGNLLQYSCLGNPMDRGAWWDTVRGVAKSTNTFTHFKGTTGHLAKGPQVLTRPCPGRARGMFLLRTVGFSS